MTVTATTLIETGVVPTAETMAYTAVARRTIIDKYTAYCAAGSGTLTVKLIPSGQTSGVTFVLAVKTFAANEAYTFPELVGHILNPGDFISEIATGTVNRRSSGREVT